ncbi:hypothetical protein PAXRUDRAFT_20935 [Paxillus rubicundulus Ve08.2h10]|uniref:Uncharacterized protein n=1 Tax=Paxillus rubicundulus Ve08.2h10 TaxID=930991 RepID=A0A0D0CCZ3_9AGAM|nr:hypothetical protein PAXRUDRAFT_20935 [Paxillus rubicundulus Ve08.2h10]
MPTIATEEVESAFCSPITDAKQLKLITHLKLSKSMDHKALEKELKERAGIATAMEKLKKEQQKVVLYSHKTQARMVAKTVIFRAAQVNSACPEPTLDQVRFLRPSFLRFSASKPLTSIWTMWGS